MRKKLFAMMLGAALGFMLTSGSRAGTVTVRCPSDMVPSGYRNTCIDRFEWPNIRGVKPSITLSALPEAQDRARHRVMDLTELCKMRGKRTCTRTEWVTACKGPGGTRFPWGNKRPHFVPGRGKQLPCNADKKWRAPDESKVYHRNRHEIDRLNQEEPSGNRSTCISHSGAYDMVGNAEEWARCPGMGTYGWCLMGRFWGTLFDCEQTVTVHNPHWHYYETGGRCCKDGVPE